MYPTSSRLVAGSTVTFTGAGLGGGGNGAMGRIMDELGGGAAVVSSWKEANNSIVQAEHVFIVLGSPLLFLDFELQWLLIL